MEHVGLEGKIATWATTLGVDFIFFSFVFGPDFVYFGSISCIG